MIGNLDIVSTGMTAVVSDTASHVSQNAPATQTADAAKNNSAAHKGQAGDFIDTALNTLEKDEKKSLNADDVKKLTQKLNEQMDNMNLQLKFTWYKDLDQLGVKMIDADTQKTIKSFPPEAMMKALIKTKEWIGKFLDENA